MALQKRRREQCKLITTYRRFRHQGWNTGWCPACLRYVKCAGDTNGPGAKLLLRSGLGQGLSHKEEGQLYITYSQLLNSRLGCCEHNLAFIICMQFERPSWNNKLHWARFRIFMISLSIDVTLLMVEQTLWSNLGKNYVTKKTEGILIHMFN